MSVSLRRLLLCLLMLAIPLQGMAAATMALCGPGHHPGSGVAAAALHEHGDADNAHASMGHAHQADASGHESTHEASHEPTHKPAHKCSACASCCSAAAIPNTVLIVPALDMSPAVFVETVTTVAPFAADGPDRPPRR